MTRLLHKSTADRHYCLQKIQETKSKGFFLRVRDPKEQIQKPPGSSFSTQRETDIPGYRKLVAVDSLFGSNVTK